MPSLSDKLKALGVKVGAQDLKPRPRPAGGYALEEALSGRFLLTRLGETFLVEAHYPPDYQHGLGRLLPAAPLNILGRWAEETRICDFPPENFAFLDTETTGLSGGTGTYAFLIGVGRFEGQHFHLAQFFMRDPAQEAAQLAALEEFLAPCQALVTFNGKAFDVPLLNTRYISHGWQPPFNGSAHVDLLHLARRLWRDRLPSRTLGNLEVQILGTRRTEEDVPGWMIPQMYFNYLHNGDARPLRSVFYHNAMDILSLAALFSHTAGLLADPLNSPLDHGIDRIALARLFEDLGDVEMAIHLYGHSLDQDLPLPAFLEAVERLALIHKRRENFLAAVELWEKAASRQHIQAHVELAKFYEHRLRDLHRAFTWTESALSLVRSASFSAYERQQWLAELEHRKNRLQRKILQKESPGSDIILPSEE